jgi:helix-turn-helix protein
MDQNINYSRHFDNLIEKNRLSHSYLIKMHIQLCNKYKHIKTRINDGEIKKYFNLVDQHFYNENGKIKWDIIYPLMPSGFEKSIKNEYSELTENEIRLCCLLLFNVQSNDIANILPYTQKSVHSITHRIKQKTGMKDIKVNLKNLLLTEKLNEVY